MNGIALVFQQTIILTPTIVWYVNTLITIKCWVSWCINLVAIHLKDRNLILLQVSLQYHTTNILILLITALNITVCTVCVKTIIESMLYNKDIVIIVDTKVSRSWEVWSQQFVSLCSVCITCLCTHDSRYGSLCDVLKVTGSFTFNSVVTVRTCHFKLDVTLVSQACWHITIELLAIRGYKSTTVTTSIFINIP